MERIQGASSEHRRRPNYVAVFLGLAALTLAEVGVTFLPIPQPPFLLALMTAKAALVALFYMHLKTDSRWYAYLFLIPLPFAILVAAALLVYAF